MEADRLARLQEALALRDRGRRSAAVSALQALAAEAPDWAEPRAELAGLLGGRRLASGLNTLTKALRQSPADPALRERLDAVLAKRWMDPQVEPLVELAVATGNTSERVWLARLFGGVRRGDAAMIATAADALAAVPRSPEATLQGLRLLARTGEIARVECWAGEALARAQDDETHAGFARELARLLSELRHAGAERYRGSANVLIDRTAGARATVVAFSGLNLGPTIPREALCAMLRPLGANLVTLTEPDRLLYLNGLAPLGAGFAATVQGLRTLAAGLGAPRLLFIAHSGGTFAAVRYAVDIPEVDQVLVTGPITILDPTHPVMARPRAKLVLERLAAVAPERMENLRRPLEARRPPLSVTVYYARDNGRDAIHAENLSGVPGVALCPVASASHDTGVQMARSLVLRRVLAAMVEGSLTADRAQSLARDIRD